jgi:hypothetical protein
MGIIIFNLPGIVMTACAIGIAFGLGEPTGWNNEGFLTSVSGAFVLTFDLAYRLMRRDGHWYKPDKGGSLFFLPAWVFGILWFILGIVYIVRGD